MTPQTLHLEQVLEIGGADRQQEIEDDREHHQPGQESLLLAVQCLEARIGDDGVPVDVGRGAAMN